MPIPFIVPVLLMAGTAASAAKGGADLYTANNTRSLAAKQRREAEAAYERCCAETERAEKELIQDHERLVMVQVMAMAQLEDVVRWLKKGRIKNAERQEISQAAMPDLELWRTRGVEARQIVHDAVNAVAGAAGARALAVHIAAKVGIASTGAAISGLSGAAARNATLAWLGGGALASGGGGMALGGAVLTSLNIGVAVLGAGFTARKVAAAYQTSIAEFVAEVETEIKRQEGLRTLWTQLRRRMAQLRRATNAVAAATSDLLKQGNPRNDEHWISMVKLGKALGALGRYRTHDEYGNLIEGWKNPYAEIRPLGLRPNDTDFTFRG